MLNFKHQRGMNLVEVLVASLILFLILGLSYRGLNSMLKTREAVPKHINRWSDIERAFDRIEYDFMNVSLTTPISPTGHRMQPIMLDAFGKNGALATLTLSKLASEDYAGSDGVLVGYRLRHGKIELLIWPTLYLAPAGQNTDPAVYTLLDEVDSFKVYLRQTHNSAWLEQFPETKIEEEATPNLSSPSAKPAEPMQALPKAIRIEIKPKHSANALSRTFARF